MGKLIALALVGAGLFFLLHDRGASADNVAECLRDAGATVTQTRFLEENFSALAGGQQLPPELTSRLRKVENGNYDVELSGDNGLLMVVNDGTKLEQVQHSLAMAGGVGIAQGSGRVVLYWYGQPLSSSQSAASSCFD